MLRQAQQLVFASGGGTEPVPCDGCLAAWPSGPYRSFDAAALSDHVCRPPARVANHAESFKEARAAAAAALARARPCPASSSRGARPRSPVRAARERSRAKRSSVAGGCAPRRARRRGVALLAVLVPSPPAPTLCTLEESRPQLDESPDALIPHLLVPLLSPRRRAQVSLLGRHAPRAATGRPAEIDHGARTSRARLRGGPRAAAPSRASPPFQEAPLLGSPL